MKPRISRLTLELYHRGLATRKERKMVEKALLSDISVRERYEAIKESNREINQLISKELSRLNIPEPLPTAAVHSVNIIWVIAAVVVLLGAIVPAFLYLKSHKPEKENVKIEETVEETTTETETLENPVTDFIFIEEIKPAPSPQQPIRSVRTDSNPQTGITVSPRGKQEPEEETEPDSKDFPSGSYTISIVPSFDEDSDEPKPINQEDKDIPAGITSISEGMFAYKFLGKIFIPARIRSVAKNAYEGNPVLIVTIGANVNVHEEAIPGNFAKAYNDFGRKAGTYMRSTTNSEGWVELESQIRIVK